MCATLCNETVMILIESRENFEMIDERSLAWCGDAHLDVVGPIRDVL